MLYIVFHPLRRKKNSIIHCAVHRRDRLRIVVISEKNFPKISEFSNRGKFIAACKTNCTKIFSLLAFVTIFSKFLSIFLDLVVNKKILFFFFSSRDQGRDLGARLKKNSYIPLVFFSCRRICHDKECMPIRIFTFDFRFLFLYLFTFGV